MFEKKFPANCWQLNHTNNVKFMTTKVKKLFFNISSLSFGFAIATLLFVARDNPAPLFALAPQAKAHWQEQGAATAFVCRNYHCLPAVNTGQQLQEQCSGSAP